MLGIHRQNVHAVISRLPHHNLARHHQNLLARDGEIFAGFNCRERRTQTARANDRYQYHVGIGQAGDLAQTDFSRKNSRLVIERTAEHVDLGFIDETNKWCAGLIRSRGEFFGVTVRCESDDFHPLRNVARHFERTFADGSGRAQDNDTFTLFIRLTTNSVTGNLLELHQPQIKEQQRRGEKQAIKKIERAANSREQISRVLYVSAALDD